MKIVIIGNGIAGTSAARFIRKYSDHEILMIADETLQPFSRTALMYVYMGHVKQEATHLYENWFWAKNRIERMQARVEKVLPEQQTIRLQNGAEIGYDRLVIATGSVPNRFGWPGEHLDGVQGLYHLHDLETMERHSAGLQHAVIVGGGLIGVEMAEMLHSRHIPVTFLVREKSYWGSVLPPEEGDIVARHLREYGIDLRLDTQLAHIEGDAQGRVAAVTTSRGERIACGLVGITAGVRPNIDFLRDSGIELGRGVLVNDLLETSAPHVYAIGDCAELRRPDPGRKPVEAVWYTGRMMGQALAATLCGRSGVYRPGIWFNSAKFFDIEYQTYGAVLPAPGTETGNLYWEHPQGKKSIRIQYDLATGAVLGFNLMGIRYRHEVCERWIATGAHIETVLPDLPLANFDPEFSRQYEQRVLDVYNQRHSAGLRLSNTRSIDRVRDFLRTKMPFKHPQHP